jgi:AcrR family transcriptional regulator
MINDMPPELTTRQVDLLDRLTDLVVAEGFAHLTLDDVAGRLRCSKTTLYALAASKDQLAVRVVNNFFRRSTALVEARVSGRRAPRRRIEAYLDAIAEALQPASRRFIEDVAAFEPTRATYRDNAVAAARRVRELIDEAASAKAVAPVDAAFVATWLGVTIEAIQRGEFAERAGLGDSAAFGELSRLVGRALANGVR